MGGSSKKQTVGYRFYMGLHFGLCHGPVDAFLELRGGDRTAWQGEVTTSDTVLVVAPELWGGEKKEGGIEGRLDVLMGEDTQVPHPYLVEQLGPTVPGFRGMLSLVWWKGLIGAMNPYPKPWKFQVRRAVKGWHDDAPWYPEKAEVPISTRASTGEPGFPLHVIGERVEVTAPSIAQPTEATAAMADQYGWTYTPLGDTLHFWRSNESGLEYSKEAESSGETDVSTVNTLISRGWALNETALVKFQSGGLAVCVITEGSASGPPPAPSGQAWSAAPSNPLNTTIGQVNLWLATADWEPPGALLAAMNAAHIAYESLTNPDWGLGYPAAVLDATSFAAAADTFHAEGMGLCLQWARQDTVEGFIQDVMNHAGAVLAQDPRTGLFRLLPIRGGYDVMALPEFRRGLNVLSVEGFERAAITETVNEVTVQYVDALTGKEGSVTVQHLANIQAQGGVASQTIRYPGAPTSALAQRMALRDLNAKAQPLCKVRLIVNRSGYGILPGEVVRWSDDRLGIEDMPMRVLHVDYGTRTAGAITLDLAEDVFGLPATTYLGQQDPGWEEPSGEPLASPMVEAFEAPYVALHRDQGASVVDALAPEAGFLAMVAARPTGVSYGFTLYTRVGSAEYEETGADDWAQGGPLAADVGPLDTALVLGSPFGLETVGAGYLAMLGDGDDAELVRIDAVDLETDTVTVGRGVGDTVPKAWPLGTRLWVIEDNVAASVTEFTAGESVDAKAATRASAGELPVASAPGDSVTMDQRQARPYPPGLLRITDALATDAAYPESAAGAITASWAHRDRLLQADQLIAEGEASIGPEVGTTYTVRYYLDDVLEETESGITGTSATPYTLSGDGTARVEVEAVRDGLESWQAAMAQFAYLTVPADVRVTDAADTRITDSGDRRITE